MHLIMPLGVAAARGHVDVMRLLVSRGAWIDPPPIDGYDPRPFVKACIYGQPEAIKYLYGLDNKLINKVGPGGHNVLHDACLSTSGETVRLLHDLKPDMIREQVLDGGTTLSIAAEQGHVSCMEVLLELAPDLLEVPNFEGCTPLHCAAYLNKVEAAELLIKKGANGMCAHPPSTIDHPPSTIHHPPSTIHRPPSTVHHPPDRSLPGSSMLQSRLARALGILRCMPRAIIIMLRWSGCSWDTGQTCRRGTTRTNIPSKWRSRTPCHRMSSTP